LKEDVEKNLPSKKEIILYARMTEDQRKIQEHLLNKSLITYLHARSEYGKAMKTRLENLMLQLRKNFNHPDLLQSQFEISYHYPPVEKLMEQCGKFQLLDRLLKHLRARNHKVLIFSQWTRVLDLLDYCLSESGHDMCRIDGSVKLHDRQRQIKDFNDPNSNLHIFLLSTRAGGLGINLTAADTCIIYDSDWNPQMDLQAMDRCHRIGQTKPVHVYRLCTSHSAECRMLKVAFDKLKLERVVIEKGQFHQERTNPGFSKESELLALLQQERDEEEELVQSDEISESNLLKLLDRRDMINDSLKVGGAGTDSLPLKGPGWEIVVRGGQVGGMLSSIEGYKQYDDKNL
jgi:ATP-dependent DNA helicase